MRNRLIQKGNMHRSDHLRTLLTDTLPGDIPIVISNDGFYRNMKPGALIDVAQREFVENIMTRLRAYTIPYRFNILRPGGSPRRLSLTHPSAQLAVVEFYKEYAELICYHCRKSEASIRSPRKVGSTYFVRGPASERNMVKGARIDTLDVDKTVSNPASYFAYKGVDRAFKFFASSDYMRLEKRYAVMHFADVSKCFNSIYTHTLFWAVADMETAKDNTGAVTFSNSFDNLMQSMNHNETNGICIGAEVSRIFAELILSEVDRRVIQRLAQEKEPLHFRVHYEFRRYVDDIYLFSQNAKVAERVLAKLSLGLSEFNLHFNDKKTHAVPRPFITTKSRMVRDASQALDDFFAKFIRDAQRGESTFSYPVQIRQQQPLLRSLLESVKASCFDNQSGYETTSNYVIGALSGRVSGLIAGYQSMTTDAGEGESAQPTDEDYVASIMLLLEALYFFYNVDPTVPSSLRVAQAAVRAHDFFSKHLPESKTFLAEQIVRWTFQFIKELSGNTKHRENSCVPLEAINVLLVLGEVGRGDALAQKAILEFCGDVSKLEYFEIVSYLFCLKDDPQFAYLRNDLFERAKVLLSGKYKLRIDAHAAHLALDILSCPFISAVKRGQLFKSLRSQLDLSALSHVSAQAAVAAFEASPWFVNWRGVDLLTMIRKKELSAVY